MEKKVLYIIIAVVAVVLIALVGMFAKTLFFASRDVDYRQNSDGSQTYSNDEGSVTVGQNVGMPSEWPSDAPGNYAGATILFSGNSNPQTGEKGVAVSYTLQGISAKAVVDHYVNALTSQGWVIEANANMGAQTVIGASKGDRTFGINITDSGNGALTVIAGAELK